MKLREDIRPITHLKTRAADLVKQVNTTRRPVVITRNGVAQAVLQDVDSYEKTLESLAMLQIVFQGKKDIEEGHVVDHDTAMKQIEQRIADTKAAHAT